MAPRKTKRDSKCFRESDVLIRLILDQNGWTLQILAELLGVSKTKMSLCLSGKRSMSVKEIAILKLLLVPELDAEKLSHPPPKSFDIASSTRVLEALILATEVKLLKAQEWLLRIETYRNKHSQDANLYEKQAAFLKTSGLPKAMARTLLIRQHAAAANTNRFSPKQYIEMKGKEVALIAQLAYYRELIKEGRGAG